MEKLESHGVQKSTDKARDAFASTQPTSPSTRSWTPNAKQWSLLLLISSAATWLSLYSGWYKAAYKSPAFEPITAMENTAGYPSFSLNITHLYNNKAAGPGADFDPHSHGAYPAEYLPTSSFVYDGIQFALPENWSSDAQDNMIVQSQSLKFAEPRLTREFHVLYAGDWIDGESEDVFTFNFEDGTSEHVELSAKNWWTLHWLNQGVIRMPYHLVPSGINHNVTQIYHWSTAVSSDSALVSIILPNSTWPNHLHVFAASVVVINPESGPQSQISIRRAIFTTQWEMIDGIKAWAVEVTVANPLPSALAHERDFWIRSPHALSIFGSKVRTVRLGWYYRIAPSDEKMVKVWVVPIGEVEPSGISDTITVVVQDQEGNLVNTSGQETFEITGAISSSPSSRNTPEWWDDAKFGIFIHWGIYSVPAWSPGVGGWYAAWYNWWLHKWPQPWNGYWKHHIDTYGPDVTYDDFIANFTASEFNASSWVNLFADAGAKYFVLVTKHHDGFALFDTKDSTHRSSYHLGPKRDFIRELFDAAKAETPDIKRGTYITMPEWFNPDAGAGGYGFGDFPGHLPVNPYNESSVDPYTGRLEGKDYLRDIQLEHMKMLAYNYETEIMWCDIGGPNLTREFAEDWYPFAESQGRQVVMNNRCGDLPQFDTPEYSKFSSIQTVKWETSEGIDPTVYGYRADTKDYEYKSAERLLHTLIDIVSKNGNYLLNLGPTGTGLIIKPMVDRVLEVGRWLKHSGDCIYGTRYFFLGAEHRSLRFTQTPKTFCIISLERPINGTLDVHRLVPVIGGDSISLLGGGKAGQDLKWKHNGTTLIIDVPEEAVDQVDHAWAFQVTYAFDKISARN
ncbi:hypothetical protein FRB93_011586 [Tulasnella sp. JGI-2019a]|nr:hypothetical protein FRB93_011586 [Tulasnella sp. JGI-2019a]